MKNKISVFISLGVTVYVTVVMASACSPIAASIPQVAEETITSTSKPDAQHTVTWNEFGETISLSYDPGLSAQVTAQSVPAVPVSDQILFSEAHPAYAQFLLVGYQDGRSFELPVFPFEAQVRVFQTAHFPGFGDDLSQGFVNQKQALIDLLSTGLHPELCAQPLTTEAGLPFLPWVNMKQTFCAQPEVVEFSSGKGIRYLTYYSQGPNPVLDQQVFYTFQGITNDGQFYVSALFPVETGIFPNEAPACTQCGDANYDPFAEWTTVLAEQLLRLNALPAESFAPSLTVLDDVVRSVRIGQ